MNAKQNNLGSINQQARLLMVDSRQRKHNRQASMLERSAKQVGLE
jgi:hypothetical protein